MSPRRAFCLALLAVVITASPLLAREVHSGRLISVGKSSVTIRDDRDGENDKIEVTAETKITRNGKPAKLSDLGVGDKTKVEASEVNGKLTAKSIDAFMPE